MIQRIPTITQALVPDQGGIVPPWLLAAKNPGIVPPWLADGTTNTGIVPPWIREPVHTLPVAQRDATQFVSDDLRGR